MDSVMDRKLCQQIELCAFQLHSPKYKNPEREVGGFLCWLSALAERLFFDFLSIAESKIACDGPSERRVRDSRSTTRDLSPLRDAEKPQ